LSVSKWDKGGVNPAFFFFLFYIEIFLGEFKVKIRLSIVQKYGSNGSISRWREFLEPVIAQINRNIPSNTQKKAFFQQLVLQSIDRKNNNRIVSIQNLPIITSFKRGEKVHLLYTSVQKAKVGFKYTNKLGKDFLPPPLCLRSYTFLNIYIYFRG